MRGAQTRLVDFQALVGIIPADAGSTGRDLLFACRLKDHPRGCGEHVKSKGASPFVSESSPRMRGARSCRCRGRCQGGIIPADAGSTFSLLLGRCAGGDHPRGCGEHIPDTGLAGRDPGSSPRMRGARKNYGEHIASQRIIPADAGSTRHQCAGGRHR